MDKFKVGDIIAQNGRDSRLILEVTDTHYKFKSGGLRKEYAKNWKLVSLRFKVGDVIKRLGSNSSKLHTITAIEDDKYVSGRSWVSISVQDKYVLMNRSLDFEAWVEGITEGIKGKQNNNPKGHYIWNLPTLTYIWVGDSGKRLASRNYDQLKAKYGNGQTALWLDYGDEGKIEEDFDTVIDCKGKSLGETFKNLKETVMREENVVVEVKVNGKIVENTEEKVVKRDIKWFGIYYDMNNELADSAYFYSKKEAKATLQKPENIGKTLELYRKTCKLTTAIPVTETEV